MDDKRLDVHCGRLTEEEMEVLMRDGSFDVVVDATHPYAQIVSQNVRQAAYKESIPFIRLRRNAHQDVYRPKAQAHNQLQHIHCI